METSYSKPGRYAVFVALLVLGIAFGYLVLRFAPERDALPEAARTPVPQEVMRSLDAPVNPLRPEGPSPTPIPREALESLNAP